MEFNFSHASEKYAEIARALGIDTRDMDSDEAGHAAIDKIRAFNVELNIPTGLGAAGLDREKIPKLGADAMLDHCHKFNPRPCKEDDMVALFEASF
jgi:alcohol dehydrogenase class IV